MSTPIRSISAHGPIGQPAPNRIARSTSSGLTRASSSTRTQSFSSGIRIRLTMKPGVSLQATGSLPSRWANANAVSKASSLVCAVRTTSTSGSTGAGLKKCMPTTRSGVCVASAICVTESAEVLVARIAGGGSEAVELAEQLALDLEILEGRLDHELAAREVGELGRQRQAAERGVLLVLGQPPLLDAAAEVVVDPAAARARRARAATRGRRPRSRPAGRPARSRHPSCRARRPRRERSPRRAILPPTGEQPLPAHLALGLDHRLELVAYDLEARLLGKRPVRRGSQPAKYISTPSQSPRQPGLSELGRLARNQPPGRSHSAMRRKSGASSGCGRLLST